MPLLHYLAAAMALAVVSTASLFFFVSSREETAKQHTPSEFLMSVATTTKESVESAPASDSPPQLPVFTEPAPSEDTPTEPVVNPETVTHLNTTIGILRGTLVNIVCIPSKRSLDAISGTGILIDERGIVLTVAHIGQYFLLDDYAKNSVSCELRTGSPAKAAYEGKLIYISESWIEDNKHMLATREGDAPDAGKEDYALIGITGATSSGVLPDSFPSLPLAKSTENVHEGDTIAVGSYGAEFLDGAAIQLSLYQTITFGTLAELYTFTEEIPDLLFVLLGANAQEGASGGAIANADNKLIGLITTRTTEDTLSERGLYAITPDHIRASFVKEVGVPMTEYLESQPIVELINTFEPETEKLKKLITKGL